jgi:uncharacterized protein YbaP (TraB family)
LIAQLYKKLEYHARIINYLVLTVFCFTFYLYNGMKQMNDKKKGIIMRKRNELNYSVILLFSLFIFTALQAQLGRHCLWELSAGTGRLYFLGSVHVLGESDYPLDDVIEQAYQASEKLYFELDMDSVNLPAVQQKIMMAGLMHDQSLKEVLSDTAYQALDSLLSELGMSIDMMQQFKPWLVASMLTMAKLNTMGINPRFGIDQYFFGLAREAGKPTGSMESINDQIRCFNALDANLEEALLLESLYSMDEIEKEFVNLKEAWKRGNSAFLDSVMNKEMEAFPDLKKVLLDDRNRRWLNRVEKMIQRQENALIIVGSGHLVGKGSLIDLLREKGYTVEQL